MKSLRPQIRSDEDQFIIGAEDLVHETAILANLNHHHIIKLHGRSTGQLAEAFLNGYFIILDKLSETLHGRFATWKATGCHLQGPSMEQMDVAHSIADAMTYLHSKKIVFRDLKPDNVGFDHNGDLKLFDFGFAIGLPEKDEGNPDGFLYDRCGTPRYMAPEVGFSLGYGTKADVYSFGILLWEMCALQKPFASIKTADAFEKQVFMEGKRPPMDRRWPANVMKLINCCWSATPSERPSMIDVKSSLSPMISNNAISKIKFGRRYRVLTSSVSARGVQDSVQQLPRNNSSIGNDEYTNHIVALAVPPAGGAPDQVRSTTKSSSRNNNDATLMEGSPLRPLRLKRLRALARLRHQQQPSCLLP